VNCAPNVLMSGPPGSGKTLLARSIPSILPAMPVEEALRGTRRQGDKETRGGGVSARSGFDDPQSAGGPRREVCRLDETGRSLVRAAMQQLQMSARAFHRIPKLARTIADPSAGSGRAWREADGSRRRIPRLRSGQAWRRRSSTGHGERGSSDRYHLTVWPACTSLQVSVERG